MVAMPASPAWVLAPPADRTVRAAGCLPPSSRPPSVIGACGGARSCGARTEDSIRVALDAPVSSAEPHRSDSERERRTHSVRPMDVIRLNRSAPRTRSYSTRAVAWQHPDLLAVRVLGTDRDVCAPGPIQYDIFAQGGPALWFLLRGITIICRITGRASLVACLPNASGLDHEARQPDSPMGRSMRKRIR